MSKDKLATRAKQIADQKTAMKGPPVPSTVANWRANTDYVPAPPPPQPTIDPESD